MVDTPRYKNVNPCAGCGDCLDGKRCEPARVDEMRGYSGVRFTSDGFDCALPVSIDSHSVCSYACSYCFADNLVQHRVGRDRPIGQQSLREIEAFFSGDGKKFDNMRCALRYDRRNEYGYPCPVQLGAICDPCDNIERQQGWLLEFMKIAIKYNQPVRISTKGRIFLLPEYQEVIAKAPHLFWVAFSIITPDDELLAKIDLRAPSATMRLQTMKALSKLGVKTSLRFRPLWPHVSDKTKNHPIAYKELIERATQAGAIAVSYEVGFVPGVITKQTRSRWEHFSHVIGVPLEKLYLSFGKRQGCMRAPYSWTENIMHAIYEEAHKNGLVCGVSDPVWKQLTDTGCCCGILPDDPVFGNWETESATNQLLLAKRDGKLIKSTDIIPAWAYKERASSLVNLGVGPLSAYDKRHRLWSDTMIDLWTNINKERGPLTYFQGALVPIERLSDGDILFKYNGLTREYPEKVPYWDVPPGLGKDTTPVLEYPRKFDDPPVVR